MFNTQTNGHNLSSSKRTAAKYIDKANEKFDQTRHLNISSSSCAINTSSSLDSSINSEEQDYVIVPSHIGDGSIIYNHKKAKEIAIGKLIQKR